MTDIKEYDFMDGVSFFRKLTLKLIRIRPDLETYQLEDFVNEMFNTIEDEYSSERFDALWEHFDLDNKWVFDNAFRKGANLEIEVVKDD